MDDWCLAWNAGCDLDWQAIGAIATFLAVAAALAIADRDRRMRSEAARSEAEALAFVLASEIHEQQVRLSSSLESNGFLCADADATATAIQWIPEYREELIAIFEKVRFPRLEEAVGRLHLLPYPLTHKLRSAWFGWVEFRVGAELFVKMRSRHVDNALVTILVGFARREVAALEATAKDLLAYSYGQEK